MKPKYTYKRIIKSYELNPIEIDGEKYVGRKQFGWKELFFFFKQLMIGNRIYMMSTPTKEGSKIEFVLF